MLCDFETRLLITQKMKMKNLLKNVSFAILLFKSCLLLGQDLDSKRIVVIDPGHGGKDSGAIGENGVHEKEVVLNIAKAILELNEKSKLRLDIYLTRYRDTLISLSDRTMLPKALKADVFVSLHCNHSDNPDARGIEVYAYNQNSVFSDDATWLAFKLQADLNEKLGFESRGVKFANFQVLRETIDYLPSVLVEFGFLSNTKEEKYLVVTKNITLLANIILKSLNN